ncbi:MAG: alkaline phosphatase family protein [Christensenellaceae bacterium]|jgi:predicted AlkP superfamily pyrophosphatase or phosphodiesterase|nr:alkaline phosphatase family protein [Christensenellaceae bacterium]
MKSIKFKKMVATVAFTNTLQTTIPATALYSVMEEHFLNNKTGKIPKLLFIGYDGCIANALTTRTNIDESAIFTLAKSGGLYLGKTGGAKKGGQETSTAPGWASLFTGTWATTNGVYHNDDELAKTISPIFYTLEFKQIKSKFCFSWDPHRSVTYKNVAEMAPQIFCQAQDDDGTFDAMKKSIEDDSTQAIFGILEYLDHAGHTFGFSVSKEKYIEALSDSERVASKLIDIVNKRKTLDLEDWLIVITTDHGGVNRGHGGRTIMESTIFFASNKKIFYST